MSFGSVALNILGLTQYVDEAKSILHAGEDGKELFDAAKELLNSEAGRKFREKVIDVMQVTHPKPDGSVYIGKEHIPSEPVAKKPHHVPAPAPAEYEWVWVGGLEGYRWSSKK